MPIQRDINHNEKLVCSVLREKVSDAEIFAYQNETWSREDVVGYDELIEIDPLAELEFVSSDRLTELAVTAATSDTSPHPTKLAIVASTDLHFGLARMYQAKRENIARGMIAVRVFRDRLDALRWLSTELAKTTA
jgi:hypothetical protein